MRDRKQPTASSEIKSPPPARPDESVSVADAISRYGGEWILMAVATYDSEHNAAGGQILAHGSNRAMCRALSRVVLNSGQTNLPLYLFSAVPRAHTGPDLRTTLEGAANAGAIGAWREW